MSQKVMLSLVFLLIVAIVVLIGYAVYAMYSGTDKKQDEIKNKKFKTQQVPPKE